MSFVDMIFGGQLTSILVCQKCKHVSQTYEDFNDISLSLKPEDYRSHRNRERFKKFVGRLTSFPSTSSSSHTHGKEKPLSMSNAPPVQVHSVELVHSSRVPSPTNKRNDDISSSGSVPEEPPTSALGKRVLNSVLGGSRENIIEDGLSRVVAIQDHDAGLEKERDSDCEAESDGSHIIVNVTGPEDRHVEFVEPKKERVDGMSDLETKYLKERKHDEATWAKLGRRLSLNLGLGRQRDKEKDKQERERKTKSMDRSPLAIGVIKEGEYCDTQIMPKSLSIGARPSISNKSNSLKNRVLSEGAARDVESSQRQSRQFTAFTTTTPKQDQSLQPASQDSASLIAQKYPTVQRSRSPKPPKPTLAETQYLRKVLADVSPPSNNPLLMLRPSLLQSYVNQDHPASRGPWDKEKEKNPWLGLGARPFTGIEECLRMFTAVEVLDGENMVGCRRCWKIQNGVLQSKRDDDSDQEDEDGDDGPLTAPITPSVDFAESAEGTRPPLNMLQRSLSISSPTSTSNPVHIQASQSTPTVSFYSQPDSRSLSPLPTSLSDANLSTLHTRRAEENCSDSPLSLSIISEGSIYSTTTTKNNDVQLQGPGGLPIPIISTTAPIDAPEASTSTPSVSSSEYNYSSASEGLVSPIANSQEQKNRANAYARLTGEPSNVHIREPHQASYSRDSLVIPSRLRYGNRKVTSEMSTDDGSSGDETDTSTRSSVSVESATSASHSSDITGAETSSVPRGMYDAKASTSAASAASEAESLQRSSSQNQLSESGRLQRKSSKSKSVIMRPAYKRYLVATPPPVLVIHLKRFQQTSKAPLMLSFSNGFKKLDDYVSFPEFLDLSPFLSPRKEDYGLGKKSRDRTKENGIQNAKDDPREERCMYRLYTVVVHIGNMVCFFQQGHMMITDLFLTLVSWVVIISHILRFPSNPLCTVLLAGPLQLLLQIMHPRHHQNKRMVTSRVRRLPHPTRRHSSNGNGPTSVTQLFV